MKFLAASIVLTIVVLFGCKDNNQESIETQTYEDIVSKLESQTEQDELLKFISIEKKTFNIEVENELEQRIDFTFLIKNLTDDKMKLSYVGYFPNELESYYLSRSKLELNEIDLKPSQLLEATQSVLVLNEEKLSEEQNQFLQNNGHIMYFAISINDKLYYIKVKLDELGLHQ